MILSSFLKKSRYQIAGFFSGFIVAIIFSTILFSIIPFNLLLAILIGTADILFIALGLFLGHRYSVYKKSIKHEAKNITNNSDLATTDKKNYDETKALNENETLALISKNSKDDVAEPSTIYGTSIFNNDNTDNQKQRSAYDVIEEINTTLSLIEKNASALISSNILNEEEYEERRIKICITKGFVGQKTEIIKEQIKQINTELLKQNPNATTITIALEEIEKATQSIQNMVPRFKPETSAIKEKTKEISILLNLNIDDEDNSENFEFH